MNRIDEIITKTSNLLSGEKELLKYSSPEDAKEILEAARELHDKAKLLKAIFGEDTEA